MSAQRIIQMHQAQADKEYVQTVSRGPFRAEYEDTQKALMIAMGEDEYWKWDETLPSTITRAEFLPIMKQKLASLSDPCNASGIETPAVTDADEDDRQEAISYMRHGGV